MKKNPNKMCIIICLVRVCMRMNELKDQTTVRTQYSRVDVESEAMASTYQRSS